jgi:hypothetical protein
MIDWAAEGVAAAIKQIMFSVRRRVILPIALCATALFASAAFAGGDWNPVHIDKITLISETKYILIVSPLRPINGGCRRVEVHGSFTRLDGVPWVLSWFYKGGPSKASHVAALLYLQKSERAGNTVNFGEMGYGLNPVNPKNICIEESRGLELWNGVVLSYYHNV